MKNLRKVIFGLSLLLTVSSQASVSLCSKEDKAKIEQKDQATIQRVAKQFSDFSNEHEFGITELQAAMKDLGFANQFEFTQALEKDGTKSEYVPMLQKAAQNSALSNKINELRPCLNLAAEVLNIKL